MICVICKHGQTSPAQVSVTLERNGTTVLIKSVPAQVCVNCGEQYVDEYISARLLQQAEQAATTGGQVEIRSYVAA